MVNRFQFVLVLDMACDCYNLGMLLDTKCTKHRSEETTALIAIHEGHTAIAQD